MAFYVNCLPRRRFTINVLFSMKNKTKNEMSSAASLLGVLRVKI